MLTSISPVGEQARGQRWWLTAVAYLVGSVSGGAAIGAVLGVVGVPLVVWLPDAATVFALAVLAALGLALDAGRLGGLPTRHRQVDERWLEEYRGWVYGVGFGFQLGLGVVTIVPASITYVVLAAAALSGSPLRGLAIGAVFGTVRALPLLAAGRTRTPAALRDHMRRLADLAAPVARTTRVTQAAVALAAMTVVLVPTVGG